MEATVTLDDTTVDVSGLKASAQVYNPFHLLVFAQSPIADRRCLHRQPEPARFRQRRSERAARRLAHRPRLAGGRRAGVERHGARRPADRQGRAMLEAHLIDLPELARRKAAGLAALGQYVEDRRPRCAGLRHRRRQGDVRGRDHAICPTMCAPMAMPICCSAGRRRAASSPSWASRARTPPATISTPPAICRSTRRGGSTAR